MKKNIFFLFFLTFLSIACSHFTIAHASSTNTVLSVPIYNSTSELLSCNYPPGTTVKTLGYYSQNDEGAAEYIISSDNNLIADNFTVWNLNNGLKAVLKYPQNKILNVAVAGIFPNTPISNRLNILSEKAVGNVNYIQFNDGTYYIDEPIYLNSFCYKGTNHTTLAVSPDYKLNYHRVICIDNAHWNNSTLDVGLQNLNILFETSKDHKLVNRCVNLLSIIGASSFTMTNCHVEARHSKENGGFIIVNAMWFEQTPSNNIYISNSTIANLTCISNDDMHIPGGCIWFKGQSLKDTFPNITMSNCTFINSTTDETIGFWNGDFTNITLDNCIFHNISHKSNNILTFHLGTFSDVKLKYCKFISYIETKNQLKLYKLKSSSSVNISHCDFINAISSDSNPIVNAFILVTDNNNTPITLAVNHSKFYSIFPSGKSYSIINSWKSNNCNIKYSNLYTNTPLLDLPFSNTYIMGEYK